MITWYAVHLLPVLELLGVVAEPSGHIKLAQGVYLIAAFVGHWIDMICVLKIRCDMINIIYYPVLYGYTRYQSISAILYMMWLI